MTMATDTLTCKCGEVLLREKRGGFTCWNPKCRRCYDAAGKCYDTWEYLSKLARDPKLFTVRRASR